MKRNLLIGFGICLLFGLSIRVFALPTTIILRFSELGPANRSTGKQIALAFDVKSDGSVSLAVDRQVPALGDQDLDANDIIWRQTGKITPDQLAQVQASLELLSSTYDQYWSGKSYLIDINNGSDLQLNNHQARGDQTKRTALEKTIQAILDLRKPLEPLITFGWSGGFGRRATQLTILPDGRLTYEDQMRMITVSDKMTQPDMELVQQLIRNPNFKGYPALLKQHCPNCWDYSIVTIGDDGLRALEFDQSRLDSGPISLKTLVTLFVDLSDREALITITTTPFPTVTVTPSPPSLKPTSTPRPVLKATPSPAPERWQSTLEPGAGTINLNVLQSSDELFIGAVSRFQLTPGQVPTDCVVFAIRGPIALATGLFGPGWIEYRNDMTEAMVAQRIQDGIESLTQYCERDKIKVVRVP